MSRRRAHGSQTTVTSHLAHDHRGLELRAKGAGKFFTKAIRFFLPLHHGVNSVVVLFSACDGHDPDVVFHHSRTHNKHDEDLRQDIKEKKQKSDENVGLICAWVLVVEVDLGRDKRKHP